MVRFLCYDAPKKHTQFLLIARKCLWKLHQLHYSLSTKNQSGNYNRNCKDFPSFRHFGKLVAVIKLLLFWNIAGLFTAHSSSILISSVARERATRVFLWWLKSASRDNLSFLVDPTHTQLVQIILLELLELLKITPKIFNAKLWFLCKIVYFANWSVFYGLFANQK